MLTVEKSHATTKVAPHVHIDLKNEVAGLRQSEAQAGRSSKALFKADDLRVVLVSAKAGTRIHEHRADGSVSILAVVGALRLRLGDDSVELGPGQLLALDAGLAHDVEAVTDCAFLVTIAWPKT